MGFRGAEGGAEGGLRVIARRKPLERIVERAGEFREGKGWCIHILSFISPGTPSKKSYVGVYGIVIMGGVIVASSILRTHRFGE